MASESREPVCATLGEQPMDVCFHPTRALVAAGLITGVVETFEYTAAAATAVTSRDVHAESCRAVRFLLAPKSLMRSLNFGRTRDVSQIFAQLLPNFMMG